MLGKIEGRRRRGQQRMRWLNGITDSMDMSFTSPGIWWWTGRPGVLQSIGSQRVRHNWATELKPSQWMFLKDSPDSIEYHYHVRSVGLYSQQMCVCLCVHLLALSPVWLFAICDPPCASVHEIFPGKNTGVGYHSLFQGIFPTQGSNLCLLWILHWQEESLPLAPPGNALHLSGSWGL